MNSWTAIASQWLEHSPLPAALLDLLLKSFVILALASGVCFGWRRAAASTRHLVWSLAVAGLLSLPVLSLLSPAWHRPAPNSGAGSGLGAFSSSESGGIDGTRAGVRVGFVVRRCGASSGNSTGERLGN